MIYMPIIPSEEENPNQNQDKNELNEAKENNITNDLTKDLSNELSNDLSKDLANDIEKYKAQSDIIIVKEKFSKRIVDNTKKLLKNKVFISYFLVYILYFFSLEGCYDGEFYCSKNAKYIITKVCEIVISAFILIVLLQLIIFSKISKKHLIHTAIIFPLFFLYSHGYEFPDHGFFNFVYYCAIILIFHILFFPFDILIFCFKKKFNKIIRYLYIIFLITSISFLYIKYIYIGSNCDDWEMGLNNTSIENSNIKYGCQIKHPHFCVYKVFNKFQDMTKIKKKSCQSRISNEKANLLKKSKSPYVNDKTKVIGYPLTNKCPVCSLDYFFNTDHLLREYFYNNLVDMENTEILEKYYKEEYPEIIIDFSNNNKGDMKINVHFNKTLSEERKLLESNSSPYSENVLIIYIDSVSRKSSMRYLKKTLNFFEKFISYEGGFNEKYPEENYHSFQFFKYYAFQKFTANNWPLLFYGQKKENTNKTLYTKFFKEKGYIISSANDFCDKENTRTFHNLTSSETFDHQLMMCDPNCDPISTFTIRCMYGKQNIEHVADYTDQFWRKYKNNRKVASIVTNHGHEGTMNVVKYIDDTVSNLLNNLFNDNLLKDSTVILLSDHGAAMPSVYYLFDFLYIEYSLPMLYILMNDRKGISYEEQYFHIQENQQTFITAFDIYNTMGNILYGKEYNDIKNKTNQEDSFKSEDGISLFNYIDAKSRFPKKYSHVYKLSLSHCK